VSIDLNELRESIARWLDEMSFGLEIGRFRFCSKNSLVPVTGRQAQVSTCFAVKSAWQAGLWESWSADRQRACIDFINSFQRPDGWFADPWLKIAARPDMKGLIKHTLLSLAGRASWQELIDTPERNLRAETRQSIATLFMVNELPEHPLPMEQTTTEGIRAYLEKFDWRQPWSAGSHLSHLMFFVSANHRTHGRLVNYAELIDFILEFLVSIRDPESGCWYRGTPPDVIKINGAMKVFSGLQWIDRPYPDCTRLLDFALKQPFQTDGCGFLNRLFVIHEAMKGSPLGYRRELIRELAMNALETVIRFQKPDGGFSFYETYAQTHYYGARVSKGLPVSDLHGTAMMVWAIALAIELIGDDAPSGSELWRAHRT